MTNPQRNSITFEQIQRLGGSLHKLHELGENKIVSAATAAEREGLQQFVKDEMFKHASEFIADWLAMHNEYEPLIMGFVGLLSRANGVLAAQAQMREQSAAAAQPQPDNVVTLDQV